jgi:hypothetical protein
MQEIGFIGERKNSRYQQSSLSKAGRPAQLLVMKDIVCDLSSSGLHQVFDLTLPAPHAFYANGIVSHNSWSDSWILPGGTSRIFKDTYTDSQFEALRPGDFMNPSPDGLKSHVMGRIEVWETPQAGIYYTIGVDPALGATDDADFTGVEVIRCDTREQVAEGHFHWDPNTTEFIDFIEYLGLAYNRGAVIIDITGGWGQALLTQLQVRNYPAIWQWRVLDDVQQRVSNRGGFVYSRRNKVALVSYTDTIIRQRQPVIHSRTLWNEMRTFLRFNDDEFGASPGNHDDAVNAYMLAQYAAHDYQPYQSVSKPKPAHDEPYVFEWATQDVEKDLGIKPTHGRYRPAPTHLRRIR